MASTTSINAWTEELALSVIAPTTRSADIRKYRENFVRKVKHHNFGRTNQFAVAEKLSGLEEKFQILNWDDVAEELYLRRMELTKHEERWVPDVLDLLLYLSHDPIRNSRVDNLHKLQARSKTPPPLKWADVEKDDPIDRREQIWSIPEHSDFSSDEDEIVQSSTHTSPASMKQTQRNEIEIERIFVTSDLGEDSATSSKLAASQFWRGSEQIVMVTEKQAIREVLFMLSGLPTSMFTAHEHHIRPNAQYRLRHLEPESSASLLQEAANIGSEIGSFRKWLQSPQATSVMQLVQSNIRNALASFERTMNHMQTNLLHQISPTGVISLLQTLQSVRWSSAPLKPIANITMCVAQNESIIALNTLYEQLDLAYSCSDAEALHTILPIFLAATKLYAEPIDRWLQIGRVVSSPEPLFISESSKPRDPTTL